MRSGFSSYSWRSIVFTVYINCVHQNSFRHLISSAYPEVLWNLPLGLFCPTHTSRSSSVLDYNCHANIDEKFEISFKFNVLTVVFSPSYAWPSSATSSSWRLTGAGWGAIVLTTKTVKSLLPGWFLVGGGGRRWGFPRKVAPPSRAWDHDKSNKFSEVSVSYDDRRPTTAVTLKVAVRRGRHRWPLISSPECQTCMRRSGVASRTR